MFDKKTFVKSLQLKWVRMAVCSSDDMWKYDLKNNIIEEEGGIMIAEPAIQVPVGSLLKKFQYNFEAFYKVGNNFKFEPMLTSNRMRKINPELHEVDSSINVTAHTRIKAMVENIRNNNTRDQLNRATGMNLNYIQFDVLNRAQESCFRKLHKDGEKGMKIGEFLKQVKKGSKRFRIILQSDTKSKALLQGKNQAKTYAANVGIQQNQVTDMIRKSWLRPSAKREYR